LILRCCSRLSGRCPVTHCTQTWRDCLWASLSISLLCMCEAAAGADLLALLSIPTAGTLATPTAATSWRMLTGTSSLTACECSAAACCSWLQHKESTLITISSSMTALAALTFTRPAEARLRARPHLNHTTRRGSSCVHALSLSQPTHTTQAPGIPAGSLAPRLHAQVCAVISTGIHHAPR
jgi:hypothetical protein